MGIKYSNLTTYNDGSSEVLINGVWHYFGNAKDNVYTGHNTASNVIHGYGGNDELTGGKYYDRIWGDIGEDVINGKGGSNSLIGGAGADEYRNLKAGQNEICIFRLDSTVSSTDTFYGFGTDDTIYLSKETYSQISNFALQVYSGQVKLEDVARLTVTTDSSHNVINKMEVATNGSLGNANNLCIKVNFEDNTNLLTDHEDMTNDAFTDFLLHAIQSM